MKLLANKNAVIIGAKGGVGQEITRQFKQHGAKVFLSDIHVEGTKEKVELGEIRQLDSLNEDALKGYFDWFDEENVTIDILINCSGANPASHQHGKPATEVSYEDFMSPLKSSLASHFLSAKYAYPVMKKQGSGTIIFITSTLAHVGCPWSPALSATHAGAEGLMKSLANEWGPDGIRVLGVRSEAMLDTPTIDYTYRAMGANIGLNYDQMKEFVANKTSLKKLTNSSELADVVAFAGSDMASYMTGTMLNHSGGHILN
ncbi:SDR family NAD(P)-dependent oxidoreductase [Fulvivirga sp. M361]|uniref:SDR family NAD(P)-dependent oxidoreductase n=1 Tax=Fulvivirga sp. M361 TaxID=2594266 RepID=UPI001C887E6D|nr:SDR family oxidoreductase [Fulvivirga sp. M361]